MHKQDVNRIIVLCKESYLRALVKPEHFKLDTGSVKRKLGVCPETRWVTGVIERLLILWL